MLLGRIPDPEGRSFFLEKTKSGVLNVASLVQSFVYSEEFRKRRLFHFQPVPATGLEDGLLVRTARLDDTLKDLERLDVIKIDVEGAEYRALAGALQLLNRFRPLIFSEFSPTMLKKVSGVGGAIYLEFLERLGYSISILGLDGQDIESGGHLEDIIDYYERQNTTHIDIIARPV